MNNRKNLQDSSPSSPNKGWDFVASIDDSAFTYYMRKFIPENFVTSLNKESYTVTATPDSAEGTIIDANNQVQVKIPVSGKPSSSKSTSSAFTGTTVIQFDISKVALNVVRNANYLKLNGTSAYLNAPSNATFNTNEGFAMESWIKPMAKINGVEDYQTICGFEDSSQGAAPVLLLNAKQTQFAFRWGWNAKKDTLTFHSNTAANILDGNWHHIAVSVSNNVVSFYLDGISLGTKNIPSRLTGSGQTLNIGHMPEATINDFFQGQITDLRVWNAPRTQADIQTRMNVSWATSKETLPSTDLIELWPFSGDQNSPVNQVDAKQMGSLQGGATISQIPSIPSTYFINFLSDTIDLKISSDFGNKKLENHFNTGLTTILEQNILPYAQKVNPDFQFKDYNGLIRPSQFSFLTLATDSKDYPYQITGMSMFDHSPFPSEFSKSDFKNDTRINIAGNSSSNVTVSISDQQFLTSFKAVLVKFIPRLHTDDFDLVQNNSTEQYSLNLNKRVPLLIKKFWYLMVALTHFTAYLKKDTGIHLNFDVHTLVAVIKAKFTVSLNPGARGEDGVQPLGMTFQDSQVSGRPNWRVYASVAMGMFAIGFIFDGIGLFGALIFNLLLLVVMYGLAMAIANRVKNSLSKHDKYRDNTNVNFTVTSFGYDKALITQEYLGDANFKMTTTNKATQSEYIYYETTTNLDFTLVNLYKDLTFYNTKGPAKITIAFPDFLQNDVANMTINKPGWTLSRAMDVEKGNVLILSNTDRSSWELGGDKPFAFSIESVNCNYANQKRVPIPGTGTVTVEIQHSNFENGSISLVSRLIYGGNPPVYHTIKWGLVEQKSFSNIKNLQQSPMSINTANTQFQVVINADTQNPEDANNPLNWNIGYQYGKRGVEAQMKLTSKPYSTYNGRPIAYNPNLPDSSSNAFIGGYSLNPGFSVSYAITSDEAGENKILSGSVKNQNGSLTSNGSLSLMTGETYTS